MEKKFPLIFDEVILKQLEKVARDERIKDILTRMFNKIELVGPYAGKLLDPQISLYECKNKHPPLRLYFKHDKDTDEIYLFKFEMKTSEKKQQKTIENIKMKASKS